MSKAETRTGSPHNSCGYHSCNRANAVAQSDCHGGQVTSAYALLLENSIRLCSARDTLCQYLPTHSTTCGTLTFSPVNLASGYWHVKVDNEYSMLTTFQTCQGRYRWLRLPFVIFVSSEIFQRKLIDALEGLEGIICMADDVVIHGMK